MEQVRNEQTIYSTAVYCRLSKDDEQAGESVSIETQKMMLENLRYGGESAEREEERQLGQAIYLRRQRVEGYGDQNWEQSGHL